jgi:hypothetical protein
MRAIARAEMRAYLAAMPAARLFRLLTILALVLMPIGMIPGAGLMALAHAAQPAQAIPAHCAGMDRPPALPQPDRKADCAIACSALPSIAPGIDAPRLAPALVQAPLLSPAVGGLHPEAATPPPRCT